MRVMVFVKATNDSENGVMPESSMFEEMGRYNEELVNAGIMQGGKGCNPRRKRCASTLTARRAAFRTDRLRTSPTRLPASGSGR